MSIKTNEYPDCNDADWRHLFQTMNAYINSQALFTACELDLFTILSLNKQMSLDQIAEHLNFSRHSTRILLLCICNTKLIVKDPETNTYHNSSAAEKLLVATNKHTMLNFIKFNALIQEPTTKYFTRSLQNEKNLGLDAFPGEGETLYQRLCEYPELEEVFQKAISDYSIWLISNLLKFNLFDNCNKMLDLGGGDGTTAMHLCKQYPNLNISILDNKNVCLKALDNIENNRMNDRIKCTPCDVFNDEWPNGFDAIFASHFVEIFSPEVIKSLYIKIYNYLPQGGQFIMWAAMSNELETAGLQSAKSSMYFLTTASGGGMTYPMSDHKSWLEYAGFSNIKYHASNHIEHTAVVASK